MSAALLTVNSPVFDGPLDALVAFVRDHAVDLGGVDLREVCRSYHAFVLERASEDVDGAASALAALAYLLERKAWLLVPLPDEPEPDAFEEPGEIVEPTVALYAGAIAGLREAEEARADRFFRAGGAAYELPFVLTDVFPATLAAALARALERADEAPGPETPRHRRSLEAEIALLIERLDGAWRSLTELLATPFDREDVVYTFLGLLELMRQGRVVAREDGGEAGFSLAQPTLPLEAA